MKKNSTFYLFCLFVFVFAPFGIHAQNYEVSVMSVDPQECGETGSASVLVVQHGQASYHVAGGGGGWYGGGSAYAAGAGGGSSYIGGVVDGVTQAGIRDGNGMLKIAYGETVLTYEFTGSIQTFEVPEGVNQIFIEAWGAQGGDAWACGGFFADDGGQGGYASGLLNVAPEEVYYIYVGGAGVGVQTSSNANEGGWNGGGDANQYAGGGGGATDLRTVQGDLSSRLIVAGGGGNEGCPDHGEGGPGGGLVGGDGIIGSGFTAGKGGSQTEGGAAGTNGEPGMFGYGGEFVELVGVPSILWSTGETTAAISGLLPGDYTVSVSEPGGYVHNLVVTINPFAGGCSTPPVITGLESMSVCPSGGVNTLMFTVDDEEDEASDLEVTARSSDQGLVSDANIIITGSDGERMISFEAGDNVMGTLVIWVKVTDQDGASTEEELMVTIEDIEKPVAICKDIMVYLDETGNAEIDGSMIDNGSYDNCGMRLPLVDKKHFSCEDLGENTVTLTVNDFYENYDFCESIVTVMDTISPAIETMDDLVVWAEADACSAVVEFSTPLASDACGVEVVQTAGPASGSEFPAGTTEVVFTATDASGNTSESSFMVTVEIVNKAPEFTAIAAQEVPSYAGMLSIPLSGITFGADCQEQEVVSVTATSEDTDLLSSVEVDYTAGESNGMLHLYYTAGVSGSTFITVTVQDDGGTANGGTDVFEQSFELTITANQSPELKGEVDTIYVDKNTTYTADLPTGLFVDADPGDALSYSLTTKDGSALPAWGVLSPEQMQVTVSPTDLEVGEHTFLLTASDQLGATADVEFVVVVQIPTGVEDLNQAFDFVVYPNPSKGKVYVRLQRIDISEGEILIHTIGGQEIYRESYLFDKEIELDLSKEVDGVYFISIQSGGRVLTKKVILKK